MSAHARTIDGIFGESRRGKVVVAIVATFAMVVTLLFASPPTPAAAITDEQPSFVLTQNDLEFILRQIQISEAHAADELDPSSYELYCPDQGVTAQNCVSNSAMPKGVRTVDGGYNNLLVNQEHFGASDVVFPRLVPAEWQQAEPEVAELGFEPNTPEQTASGACEAGVTCYDQRQGNVFDTEPREISNLIVDQSIENPAIQNQIEAGTAIPVPGTDRVTIANTAPDEGLSAPFNTFTGFFGQFFDHGLDLVGKGGNGTIVVPLNEDDPLFVPGGDSNYITLSRATRIDDGTEHKNLTSPFIDQNQTYSSHPAHQVFLRQYALADGRPVATGRLIEGVNGGMAKWSDVKAQAATVLGIELTDADLLDVPQVVVDPYGNFVPGLGGFPQLITGDPGAPTLVEGSLAGGGADVPANALGTGHAFLDDIAHGSTPVVDETSGELLPRFDENGVAILDPETNEPVLSGYDNDTLNEHFIAGDGRVNENIGLTAVHAVFHAEHNRMVGQIEALLDGADGTEYLVAQDSDERGGLAEFVAAFRGETHSYSSDKASEQLPGYVPAGEAGATPVAGTEDDWLYQERLFQAAKFATEMQYQHLVFEEFGRKISPNIDAVPFNENGYVASVNPAITAEFAHVVYRFGHSMMTEEIGREAVDGGAAMQDVPLLTGFLNPSLFDENGTLSPEEATGSLVNGMTSRIGSQIDEHIVDVLRNNLLGLPLDLAALNLMRGRDTGIAPLQAARASFFAATGDPDLRPYANWTDFGLNTKNGDNFGRAGEKASLVNFVAAYGKHPSVVDATTLEEKRNAAALLVNGAPAGEEFILRFAGSDRFRTAALISQRAFPNVAGQPTADVPVVYITNGQNFPDALAGGAAAAAEGGPILLTSLALDGDVPSATAVELTRLNPERIVVLGDSNSVTVNTMSALAAYTRASAVPDAERVVRLGGENRFHTAALISQRFATEGEERVFIANGLNFPDALAGSAVAARDGSPILLVTPDAIPAHTAAELDRINPDELVILGGIPSVNGAVQAALGQYTDGSVRRIAGVDRYDTALKISQAFFADGSSPRAYISTGANFPDALAGGVAAGLAEAPMILVNPAGASPAALAELERLGVTQLHVLGGYPSVPLAVEEQLAALTPEPLAAPDDRSDFMNSTGAWASLGGQTVTGLEDVDFWIGGLAERLNPFGGMLGSSFNFVFEKQLEDLQFSDRFYYLFRNPGQQLFAALEGNTFSDIIQRNTDASNLPADIFALQDPVLDIDEFGGTLPEGLLQDGDGTYRWVGDEHIELHGTAAADRMRGDEGDDSIWGYEGDDVIEGGSGNDALVGGTGDDILTDLFGDDNLKGKQGNDAIDMGTGIDLGLGGSGDDFLVKGGGDGTFFAGMGDDIVLGTSGRMIVFGGEHDDWVEGSNSGGELLQGDNADQAQNDTLGGDDVVIGRLGNDDVEGEGGDDVLVGEGTGTDRYLGNIGYDWLTYYGQSAGVTSDWAFNRVLDPAIPPNPLAARFNLMEALSGGAGNDTLRGAQTDGGDIPAEEIPLHKLTEEALAALPGFATMLRPAGHADYAARFIQLGEDGPGLANEVIIGGPGSDTVEGRTGDDFIDGDSYLRVQLDYNGERFNSASGQLQARVFSGEINPGDIDIVREIVADPPAATPAVDVAVYSGSVEDYVVTDLGDGYFQVAPVDADNPPTNALAPDGEGSDILRNIERVQFSDGVLVLAQEAVVAFDTDTPTDGSTATPSSITARLLQLDGTTPFDLTGATNVVYTWSSTASPIVADSVWEEAENPLGSASPTFELTLDDLVGQSLRVTVTWTGADGLLRSVTSGPTANPVAADPGDAP